MKIHDLKPAPGSRKAEAAGRARHRRQGRQDRRPRQQGPGRARHRPGPVRGRPDPAPPPDAEGQGLQQPVPVEYHVVNLSTLDGFDAGAEVTPDTLRAGGLVAKRGLVKVLARGEITKPLTVRAHGFSAAAVRAIEAAGGTTEVLPLPWPTGRPPARGNALTNR